MAITFVSQNSIGTNTDGGSVSGGDVLEIDYPPGIQAMDLLMVMHSAPYGTDSDLAGQGWTRLVGLSTGTTNDVDLWWKVASGNESGNELRVGGDYPSNTFHVASIMCFRGVDTTNPIHNYATAQGTSGTQNSQTVTGPSVSTTIACRVLHGRFTRDNSSSGSTTTTSTDVTQIVDYGEASSTPTRYQNSFYMKNADEGPGTIAGIPIRFSGSTPTASGHFTIALTPAVVVFDSVGILLG